MRKIILAAVAALLLAGMAAAQKPAGTGATYPVKKATRMPRSKQGTTTRIYTVPPSIPWYKNWGAGGPGPAGVGTSTVKK
jgi:hypothetical protein